MIKPAGGSSNTPVPILAIHVRRIDESNPMSVRNVEVTQTELQNYYITPDDARSGQAARKMTFEEALSSFIF